MPALTSLGFTVFEKRTLTLKLNEKIIDLSIPNINNPEEFMKNYSNCTKPRKIDDSTTDQRENRIYCE